MASIEEEKHHINQVDNDILMEGYLEHKSLYLKQFRKKWFVLKTDKHLYAYKNRVDVNNGSKPKEIIDLRQFDDIILAEWTTFEISSKDGKRKRVFRNEHDDANNIDININKWMHKIRIQIQLLSTYTLLAESTQHTNNIININVKAYEESFVVYCLYSDQEKINNIFTKIKQYLNKKYYPRKLNICFISSGFTGYVYDSCLDSISNLSITNYNKHNIVNSGLSVNVEIEYEHKVCEASIECEHMINSKSENAMDCPIYCEMKENYDFSEDNLYHLKEFNHFRNEFQSKPSCKFRQNCKAYIRQETGKGDDRLNDRCHMKIYKHPPRQRCIKLQENVHSLIINKSSYQNHPMYEPTNDDKKEHEWNGTDGWLNVLISEVISNGYKSDLCLSCGEEDDCQHEEYSILKIVDEKMNCIRHKAMDSPLDRAQMLALILYTGCDCNYDLCAAQRNSDYKKWIWFDYCLYNSIRLLSEKEKGEFMVFSGLNGVKLDVKSVKSGYFVTYVSTTWRKSVAEEFMGNDEGMIIQIDKNYKNHEYTGCCDVSWISKFPDECEILFARSLAYYDNNRQFSCVVLDDSNGVQTVSLQKGQE